MRQYLYFCTSKASKLSTFDALQNVFFLVAAGEVGALLLHDALAN